MPACTFSFIIAYPASYPAFSAKGFFPSLFARPGSA